MSTDTEPAGVVEDESFFRTLVEHGSDAIISIDADSTILFANRSVERVFGYEPAELVGEPLTVVMPERFQGAHHAAIAEYVETGERTLDWNDIELPGEHKDGHEVQLSITFEEHQYDGQRVFSGIMRDVTDRVERERKLERQNEQLERFAGILSHDLRDPLNTARAQVALAKNADDPTEYLDELEHIHQRMGDLIEDVLTLTKQGHTVGEPEPVSPAAVAEEAWQNVGGPEATLHVEDIGVVQADRERLLSLFENLLGNAIRHAGDDVTVEVGPLSAGDGFYVADDGPGIPEADHADVFDYGFTTDDDGTGFGLNIVESIADAHGWTVSVTDSEAGGARFEFAGVRRSENGDAE
ncbi:two-component system sensor histidine kinase NtrB [Halobacterium noricense]|uniref:two-component system sensor histidine kinase NtrB n=1 Tax=Halobacterium noricense TaxID=223182 RepID=UPI001E517EEF|nr:PAS domain-containing sensor histidine kinase [Halobacterium noricense]UHH24258.1 PAS domain-containing sensor histidine kinase [Halobacterium noricense]